MPYRVHPHGHTDSPWACSDCGARASRPGSCPRCGEDPLLDLDDPAVVDALLAQDARRVDARRQLNRLLSLPFGLFAAAVTLVFSIPDPAVLRAPLLGIGTSWLVTRGLNHLAPPTQLWSALAPRPESAARRRKSGVLQELGAGAALVIAVVAVVAIGVTVLVTAGGQRNRLAYERRIAVSRQWHTLRRCIVARSGDPPETARALAVWNEETHGTEPQSCRLEANALYEVARMHGIAQPLTRTLDSLADCGGDPERPRCAVPPLTPIEAWSLRRAARELEENPNYVRQDDE